MTNSRKWTASVVGGGAGGTLSMEALMNSDGFELTAAADLRPEVCHRLEERFPGLRTFPNHKDMFRECPTDVVCVSTFPPSHEQVAIDALANPSLKGILVEKPLGDTAAAGRRILEAVQARLPIAVPHGLVTRSTPLEVIRLVREGRIGPLKLVEIQNDKWDIMNAGIHWLHFFNQLTGNESISSVMALCDGTTRTYRDGMQVETAAVTYVETVSGIRAVMNTGDYTNVNRPGKDTLFRIVGDGGLLEFWGWERGYRLLNAESPQGELVLPDELPVSGHRLHLESLAEQIASGVPDYRNAESSLMALEIVEAAYLSSRHRCQVKFPLQNFTAPELSDWQPGKPYEGSGGGRDGRKLDPVSPLPQSWDQKPKGEQL